MKTNGRITLFTLSLVMLVLGMSARADLALLDQAPAQAPVVIYVPNLTQLSQKLSTFNDGAALSMPNLVDLLGMFKQQLGATKGLKDDGSMMLVMTEIPAGDTDIPPAILFVPTTSYADLVTGMGGKAEEAITAVNISGARKGFARKLEGFALMSSDRSLLENYQPARAGAKIQASAGKLGAQYLATSDAVAYINIETIAPLLKEKIKATAAEAAQHSGTGHAADLPSTLTTNFANTLIDDSSGMVIGFDLNDTGLGITSSLQFKQGSYLAGLFTTGNDAGTTLNKLPALPYMFASAFNADGINLKKIVEDAVAKLPAQQANGMADIMKHSIAMVADAQACAQVYYVPAAGSGIAEGNYFNGVSVVQTKDPAAYVKTYRDYLNTLANLPAAGGGGDLVSVRSNYTEGALQLENVKADEYHIEYELSPEAMSQMGMMAPMIAGLGGTQQSGYLVNTGKEVLITSVRNDQLLRKAVASVRDDKGMGLDTSLSRIRSNLTPKPSAEAYINIAGIMNAINGAQAELGAEATKIPADVLPIGASLSVRESGIAGRFFIPTTTTKFLMQKVVPMASILMGGSGALPPSDAY